VAAVRALVREHFGPTDRLSVVTLRGDERHEVPIVETFPTYRTAAIGAGVGALFVGLIVAIAGIDFGPFTLTPWGPWWAAFEGAYMGGCVGFALGALMSIEYARTELLFEGRGARDPVVWVSLKATGARAERAEQLLVAAGARHLGELVKNVEVTDPHLPPLAA
jgi:hypothetical protein